MKKLLLCTLSLFAFVGLTACGSETKLTAEEAQTELKEISTNTLKAANDALQGSVKFAGNLNVQANNVKGYKEVAGQKTEIFTVNQASADAKANFSLNTATDFDNKLIKISANGEAKLKANAKVTGLDELKADYSADGKATVYLKGAEVAEGEDPKANAYVDYSANVSEDLAKVADLEKTKFEGKANILLNGMDITLPDDEYFDSEDFVVDFDEFINDWTIFKKKGNKIVADCSDLKAFKIDGEVIAVQEELKKYGLTLSVSKFEIGFDKEKRLTSFDFALGLKGKVDLSKLELSKEDIKDMAESFEFLGAISTMIENIDTFTGTVSVDFGVSFGATIKYTTSTITIPEDLTKIEEKTIAELMGFGSSSQD